MKIIEISWNRLIDWSHNFLVPRTSHSRILYILTKTSLKNFSIVEKGRSEGKVYIYWEGHKILRNLHLTFDCIYCGQKLGEDFAKFCGLLRIYEL